MITNSNILDTINNLENNKMRYEIIKTGYGETVAKAWTEDDARILAEEARKNGQSHHIFDWNTRRDI